MPARAWRTGVQDPHLEGEGQGGLIVEARVFEGLLRFRGTPRTAGFKLSEGSFLSHSETH